MYVLFLELKRKLKRELKGGELKGTNVFDTTFMHKCNAHFQPNSVNNSDIIVNTLCIAIEFPTGTIDKIFEIAECCLVNVFDV